MSETLAPEETTEEVPEVTPEVPSSCLTCGGARVLTVAASGLLVPCSCLSDESRWREARIPELYRDAPPATLASCEVPLSRWVFGPPGVGKTRYACRILKRYARARFGGLFVDLVELEVLRRDAVSAKEEVLPGREAMEAPFCVADDFGRNTRLTDFWREFLESFVRSRYSNGLPTVFTSNFSLEEIANIYGTWLGGRIAEMCGGLRGGRIHNLTGQADRRWNPAPPQPQPSA